MISESPALTDEVIKARTAEFWLGELDWVREHPSPDLSAFHAVVEKEKRRSNVGELPPLDIAMWPEDVFCDIDVSDPNMFNNRFIELPMETRSNWVERFFWGMHNMGVIIAIAAALSFKSPLTGFVLVYGVNLVMTGPFIFALTFWAGRQKSGTTRFNRQAQLVHVGNGDGTVAHVPWRQVRSLMSLGVAGPSALRLCAPRPRALREEECLRLERNPSAKSLDELAGPYQIPATLHYLDHASIYSNLQRLEFFRRYMEDGIKAIQPHPEAIRQGLVEKPMVECPVDHAKHGGLLSRYLYYPIIMLWHFFCLGPWLDRRARWRAEGFTWPEEVENLCGPNPDLTGLDTRPVRSRKDVYYKPDAYGYRLVNRHGMTLPEASGQTGASAAASSG